MIRKTSCPNYTYIRLIFQQGIYVSSCRLLPEKPCDGKYFKLKQTYKRNAHIIKTSIEKCLTFNSLYSIIEVISWKEQ